jgi:pimeloyl-ACP methyl ester carboxylesterase
MILWVSAGLLTLVAVLWAFSEVQARRAEAAFPPRGRFVEIDGRPIHYVDLAPDAAEVADAPAVVFIHGASGNLADPMLAFRPALEGRLRLVFIDRPGHGWSGRKGRGDASPEVQAEIVAKLLARIGVERAVIVGHSWGGSVAAAFAVNHPERTAGLLFVSAATHPWPGGVTWYYMIAAAPVIGTLFVHTLVTPIGMLSLKSAVDGVFAPDTPPADYAAATGVRLLFRPSEFVANAEDVVDLKGYVERLAPRYAGIKAPTIVISGKRDPIVYEEIHSVGLARDIPGARLVWLDENGHMPHHAATEAVVTAVEELAGYARGRAVAAREDATRG